MSEDLKRCSRCYREKPSAEYRPRRTKCKTCEIELKRDWGRANPEITREHARLHRSRYAEEHRAKAAEYARANPEKARAVAKVGKALKSGRLIRPERCELCGTDRFAIQAHHSDYSRPLDVEWICASCHKELHLAEKQSPASATTPGS